MHSDIAEADSKRDRRKEKHQAPTPSPMAIRFTGIKAWIRKSNNYFSELCVGCVFRQEMRQ